MRLLILGTGGMAAQHAKHFAAIDGVTLVGGVDVDPNRLAAFNKEHGIENGFASLDAALAWGNFDAIANVTPDSIHHATSIAALKAGKHVFCEKPLATSLEDCLAVRNAIHKSGRTFSFGLVLRYSPHYQKVKDLVASGSIGKIVSFEFNETLHFNHGGYIFGNWRRNRSVAGTHLLEKCCHDLDLANWITGSLPVKAASFGGTDFFVPENAPHASRIGLNKDGQPAYSVWKDPHGISPFSEGADIADNQVAILQYASGARATFHTNCNSGIPERRFYICGTEGGLRADLHSGIIEFQRIGHDSKIERVSDGTMDLHGGGDKRLATALAATILEGKAPLATVEDGMKACVTAFGIDEAMDTGKVIDLKPMWNRCGIELRSPAVPKPLASQ